LSNGSIECPLRHKPTRDNDTAPQRPGNFVVSASQKWRFLCKVEMTLLAAPRTFGFEQRGAAFRSAQPRCSNEAATYPQALAYLEKRSIDLEHVPFRLSLPPRRFL
jgi:hypothetical protein